MRQLMIAALAAGGFVVAADTAQANGADKCFDKGSLTYVDCGGVDWSGFYLGAHAGYAWADVDGVFGNAPPPRPDFGSLDISGFLAGGQIGYQEQFDSGLVLGVEVDYSAVWADDSQVGQAATTTRDAISAELNWLASARLRLGLAQDEWMPYLTGGVAWAGYEASAIEGLLGNTINVDETVFGGVVGGGVEVMLDENWIAGVEGLYYFFDEEVGLSPPGAAGDSVEFGNVGVARARISYKF